MDYHKILDLLDNPNPYFEEIGKILDEHHPFTEENRRDMLASTIRGKVEKDLPLLKRDMLAEKSLPTADYQNLLRERLTDAINKLQETNNWKTVRTDNIDKVAASLAVIGYTRLSVKRVVRETMSIKPVKDVKSVEAKMDLLFSKSGTWINFLYAVDAEVDDYAKGFTWSAFCDFIEEEIKSFPTSNGKKNAIRTEDIPLEFDSYFKVRSQAVKLIPFLVKLFKNNKKPRELVAMLFALKNLKIIDEHALHDNQVELHHTLMSTFGNIGERSSLNGNIIKFGAANDNQLKMIEKYKRLIDKHLS